MVPFSNCCVCCWRLPTPLEVFGSLPLLIVNHHHHFRWLLAHVGAQSATWFFSQEHNLEDMLQSNSVQDVQPSFLLMWCCYHSSVALMFGRVPFQKSVQQTTTRSLKARNSSNLGEELQLIYQRVVCMSLPIMFQKCYECDDMIALIQCYLERKYW